MRRWARHQVNEKTSESNAVRVVVPKKPKKKGIRRFVDVFIPHGGDPVLEIVRKSVFAVALMVLVGSLGYLGYELVYAPISNGNRYTTLVDDYTPDNPAPYPPGDYPAGMDDALKLLYSKNSDLRGWITYKSNFANDFLKINYPIVYSGDNDYYLHHDFYKAANAYGCLFFDKNNKLNSPADMNKALIIYGHDMVNGQMFAGLNKLIFNLANARSAPVITMNTLYEKGEYKVFSVMVLTGDVNQEAFFNAWRTSFSSGDFTQFVADVRARSMYDYSQVVDVGSDDQLLILSTCTVKSTVGFDNGRLVVVARKVRPGE
ncbi:MAG: class B sortase, partial [Oscillospiraceae bacterium]|nr:class B sortase [Oscillospiraceae bacterium]